MDIVIPDNTDPLRPVDWRYHTARRLVDLGQQVFCNGLDAATLSCVRYLQARENCHSSADWRRLAENFSDLHRAIQIYSAPQQTARFDLEGRLVARSSVQEISASSRISAQTIRWYESIAFDIWSRLSSPAFVHELIDSRRSVHDWRDFGWKLFGYIGGADLLNNTVLSGRKVGIENYLNGLQREQQLILKDKLVAALRHLRVTDDRTVTELLRLDARKGNKPDGEESGSEASATNMLAALKQLDFWAVGRNDVALLDEPDLGAAELGIADLMRVVVGLPPRDADGLKNATYPPSKGSSVLGPSAAAPSAADTTVSDQG